MAYQVEVIVGIGIWKVTKTVSLVAPPHVGEWIDTGNGLEMEVHRVFLREKSIEVFSKANFAVEADMDDYVAAGWTRL